ncbi:unnamed protein product [Owenia fusiformis]|uniref:Uncharacterized protein n=1 Tax=Owenia fusiformis TaxID=6347 RepID=A0A8J1UJV1_OWEFU|nr:unnamed protein product [Owenia fusiformis]
MINNGYMNENNSGLKNSSRKQNLSYTLFLHSDEVSFRNLIVWLEDQKIRHYKIEDRGPLRNIQGGDWPVALSKYLDELKCPHKATDRTMMLDWILGYAVRLEYGDNVEKYKPLTWEKFSSTQSEKRQAMSSNPLEDLDFESADFKAGVASLATLLEVPPHTDHKIVCKAICLIVKNKLTKGAVEKAKSDAGGKQDVVPLEQTPLGFDSGDYIINDAAKILRLLHIQDLRVLQTRINEAIVQVQNLTANPKTDTRLGKVGR